MMSVPQVQRDDSSAAFFDAAGQSVLLIKQCTQCGAYGPPRQTTCRRCGAEAGWTTASGDAALVTWTATPPHFKSPDTPSMTFGYVELAEGPWLETILVNVGPNSLHEGAPVRVTFLRPPDSEAIPAFSFV
jgi:hypothetical protein